MSVSEKKTVKNLVNEYGEKWGKVGKEKENVIMNETENSTESSGP